MVSAPSGICATGIPLPNSAGVPSGATRTFPTARHGHALQRRGNRSKRAGTFCRQAAAEDREAFLGLFQTKHAVPGGKEQTYGMLDVVVPLKRHITKVVERNNRESSRGHRPDGWRRSQLAGVENWRWPVELVAQGCDCISKRSGLVLLSPGSDVECRHTEAVQDFCNQEWSKQR